MHQGLKLIYEESYYDEKYSDKTKMNITSFYVNVGFKF